MRQVLALLMLLAAVPGTAWGQDRAAELEARRQARIAALAQRGAPMGAYASARPWGPGGMGCFGWGSGGWAAGGYGPAGVRVGGFRTPSAIPGLQGSGGAMFGSGAGWYPGCLPGWGDPYLDPYGYRFLPNPYDDWRAIWGRGWTDDTAVPPYHRFQYRFFPETLPDPTRNGYVTPDAWRGTQLRPTPPPAAPGACARVRVETEDGVQEALVGLPLLGAATPDALRAVLLDRIRRGGGVVVRDLGGYVFRFPPAPAIQELTITDC